MPPYGLLGPARGPASSRSAGARRRRRGDSPPARGRRLAATHSDPVGPGRSSAPLSSAPLCSAPRARGAAAGGPSPARGPHPASLHPGPSCRVSSSPPRAVLRVERRARRSARTGPGGQSSPGPAGLRPAPRARGAAAGGPCPGSRPAPRRYALRARGPGSVLHSAPLRSALLRGCAAPPAGGPSPARGPRPCLSASRAFAPGRLFAFLSCPPRRAACAWACWARCVALRGMSALPRKGDWRGTCPPSRGSSRLARRRGDGGGTCPLLRVISSCARGAVPPTRSYRPSWDKQESSIEASSSDSLCASGSCQREQRPG